MRGKWAGGYRDEGTSVRKCIAALRKEWYGGNEALRVVHPTECGGTARLRPETHHAKGTLAAEAGNQRQSH